MWLLDFLLKKFDVVRVIFVMCFVGKDLKVYWVSYVVFKVGLEFFVKIYVVEYENMFVNCNLLDFGLIDIVFYV